MDNRAAAAFAGQLRALVRATPRRHRDEIERDLARLTTGGIRSLSELVHAAQSDSVDRSLRSTSAWAIGRLRPRGWVRILGRILTTDSDAGAVHSAVEGLRRSKSSPAIATIRHALERGKAPVNRAAAAWALGALHSRSALHSLIRIVRRKKEDPVVTGEAAEALGYIRSRLAVRPLMALLEDPNPEVRFQAVFGLGTIGDPSVLPALDRLRDDATEVRNWGAISKAVAQAKESIEMVRPKRSLGKRGRGDSRKKRL